jgi:hypothetical protein
MVLLSAGSTFGEKPEKMRHEPGDWGHPNADNPADDLVVCEPSVLWLVRSFGPRWKENLNAEVAGA